MKHDDERPGEDDGRYLYDGTGAPDADVQRLERLLRPLRAREDLPVGAARHEPESGGAVLHGVRWMLARRRLVVAAGIAAVLALGAGIHALRSAAPVVVARTSTTLPSTGTVPPPAPSTPSIVRDAAAEAPLDAGAWVEASEAGRELLVGDVGRVLLAPRSRLQVRHATDDTTLLYLARGSMEAFVSADARPRFFQVDTDAARCVDLGCRYTLDVAEDGVATVRVTTGQVAFETKDREVFIPAGAVCVARLGAGPGTPRFEGTRAEVASAFDAFDRARGLGGEVRRSLARAALDLVRQPRETLPVWHLLQDLDPEIARAAEARLVVVAGACTVPCTGGAAEIRQAWKQDLHARCW